MSARLIFLLSVTLLTVSCNGGDKHLPSSNPPEYDPPKVNHMPTPAAPSRPPSRPATPAELELLRAKLDSLERSQKEKTEEKSVSLNQGSLQLFKGITSPCEALSRLAQGLGSGRLFEGNEGMALKKALGPDADDIALRMDEQLMEGLQQSFGPRAADCPISERPRKKSNLSQAPRLVLTGLSSSQPLLFAQTTIPDTSQEDYDVRDPGIQREEAPPDWEGYQTAHTVTRIGKVERPTAGVYESYDMVIAPKAKRCPHLEGPDLEGVAEGTFEWSFVMARATPEQPAVLYRRHVVANLKGKVSDDAKVDRVDFDVTVTLQHIGRELAPYSQSIRSSGSFRLDLQMEGVPQELRVITVSGFSEGEAQARDVQLIGTLTALMAYFSHEPYHRAQAYWNNPNRCVEIVFNPATKTQSFAADKSYLVKTELRTKKEQAVVPAKFRDAKERPREGNGTVSPREKESQRDTPVTFTYRAARTRVRHSGFRVEAVSRAGKAEVKDSEWELADGSYVLEFDSTITAAMPSGQNYSLAVSKSTVHATVGLQFMEGRGWVGGGMMDFETVPMNPPAKCSTRVYGKGMTTFHVTGGSISKENEPFAVTLYIKPGETQDISELNCGYMRDKSPMAFWNTNFYFSRMQTHDYNTGEYEIADWTLVRDSDVIAKKTITVNCSFNPMQSCREVTELTLKSTGTSE
ncbi:MAG: hypothetical protein OJF51_002121 [Nitrospira sp.]|jgi:hypothetical protein|nr:MAG: hypothetical protein OJF51_002121 [Nitrospira sp.]